jgi:hypothetical protein
MPMKSVAMELPDAEETKRARKLAQEISALLNEHFKPTVFTVNVEHYDFEYLIDIFYKDGPTTKEIEHLIKTYDNGRFTKDRFFTNVAGDKSRIVDYIGFFRTFSPESWRAKHFEILARYPKLFDAETWDDDACLPFPIDNSWFLSQAIHDELENTDLTNKKIMSDKER